MTPQELDRMSRLSKAVVAHDPVEEDDLFWLFAEIWSAWGSRPDDEPVWAALVRVARSVEYA
jgi:hypothetical protein